jgi:hypothetical protein
MRITSGHFSLSFLASSLACALAEAELRRTLPPAITVPCRPRHRVPCIARLLPVQIPSKTVPGNAFSRNSGDPPLLVATHRRSLTPAPSLAPPSNPNRRIRIRRIGSDLNLSHPISIQRSRLDLGEFKTGPPASFAC